MVVKGNHVPYYLGEVGWILLPRNKWKNRLPGDSSSNSDYSLKKLEESGGGGGGGALAHLLGFKPGTSRLQDHCSATDQSSFLAFCFYL